MHVGAIVADDVGRVGMKRDGLSLYFVIQVEDSIVDVIGSLLLLTSL